MHIRSPKVPYISEIIIMAVWKHTRYNAKKNVMDCPKHENYINENGIINMKTY